MNRSSTKLSTSALFCHSWAIKWTHCPWRGGRTFPVGRHYLCHCREYWRGTALPVGDSTSRTLAAAWVECSGLSPEDQDRAEQLQITVALRLAFLPQLGHQMDPLSLAGRKNFSSRSAKVAVPCSPGWRFNFSNPRSCLGGVFRTESGRPRSFTVYVGASSRDIHGEGKFTVA
jgi:hypothetical protein